MMEEEKYYQISSEASSQIGKHPGLLKIKKLASKAKTVLDVGCGEGARLQLFRGKSSGNGIDINRYAIKKAKKQYPSHKFSVYKGTTIPFKDYSFDFVYTTFVLEHTQDPKKFIEEIIRVTKKKGNIAILCPNYGAPNRRSPVSVENPVKKLMSGFLGDFFFHFNSLDFKQVTPKKIFKEIDDDTTQEPYLLNLLKFIKSVKNVSVQEYSSLWSIDDGAKSVHQKIFKLLGELSIFPFKFWGPQLFVVLKKK